MLARLSILLAFACGLIIASPLPQAADAPVSTLSINPAAPSPEVSSSSETSSNSTAPGANLSQLLGNLNKLQAQNGAGADALDAENEPSTAFANFDADSPAAAGGPQGQGGAAPLGGLLASIKQATDLTSGMSLESKAGGPTLTSAQVLVVETTAAPEVSTGASSSSFFLLAVFPADSRPPLPRSQLLRPSIPPSSLPPVPPPPRLPSRLVRPFLPRLARSRRLLTLSLALAAATFDLNNFLAGASFPAQATTGVAGIVASAA